MTTSEFIRKARKIHGDRYDYSKSVYSGCHSKLEIVCDRHGSFRQDASEHLRGKDCVKCGLERTHLSTRYSPDEWRQKASKVHGNVYDYSNVVYNGGRTTVTIRCPKHGNFRQTADTHIQGRGCPSCNLSKAEVKIKTWLDSNHIPFVAQKIFSDCKNPITNHPFKFDFYIPSRNLLIEYDGEQHFHPIPMGKYKVTVDAVNQTKRRDRIKTKYARSHGIRLIRISYKKFSQIHRILSAKV